MKWTDPSRLDVDVRTLSKLMTSVLESSLTNIKQNINDVEYWKCHRVRLMFIERRTAETDRFGYTKNSF